MVGFGTFAALLVIMLPDTDFLSASAAVQGLARFVPSAAKSAAVSKVPNLALVFLTTIFWLAPALALVFVARFEAIAARVRAIHARRMSTPILLLRTGVAIVIFAALLAFLYLLPGTPRPEASFSRGQAFFSLMVGSRKGLLLTGPLLAAAVFCLWWVICVAAATVGKALIAR